MFRVIQISILAVALSALFAPAAFAERPDDSAGKIGVGSVQPTGATYAHPERPRGCPWPRARSSPRETFTIQADEGGFDWAAAVVGALGAFAVALLLIGGIHAARRERHVTA